MAVFLSALFAVLVVSAICMFYYVFGIPDPEGISIASFPHFFTENFSFWIEEEDGKISVNDTGIERLEQYGLWIQIMDESGTEVYSYSKPADYATSYSTEELISLGESKVENGSTLFLNNTEIADRTFFYIIGFPYSIEKSTLYYNGKNVARLSPFAKNLLFCVACMFVLCAFVYAFWLSHKMETIIGGIKDISNRKYKPMKENGVFSEIYGSLNKMDADLRHSEMIQKETERTRQEWITNITHDLKTPLSPIKGYAELLTEECCGDLETIQNYGEIVLKNANHMEKLINDLKLTYQLEAGTFPYNPQKIYIVRFLKELVIDIANDPIFSKRKIEFDVNIPETMMVIDPDLIRRAVGNIIVNALIHNTFDTSVTVSIKKTAENRTAISIRDDGRGMSDTEMTHLWDRYYRGTNTEEKTEGSGLGLAIAKQIILLHGGDIVVSSKPGVGTEFIILLETESSTDKIIVSGE